MQDADPQSGQRPGGHLGVQLGQGLRLARGLLALAASLPDAGDHDVGLATTPHLLAHPLPRPVEPGGAFGHRDDGRLDRLSTGGELAERRDLQISEHRHRDGARDGRGRHDQHVGCHLGAVDQRCPLLDAEPVLLVDDQQTQLGELHVVLDQRMGADDEAGLAGG